MKITVIHKGTTIIVDESDNQDQRDKSSMRWENQNVAIQETLIVMIAQCKKLQEAKESR